MAMRPKLFRRTRRVAVAVGLAAVATGALAHALPASAAPAGLDAVYAKQRSLPAALKTTYFTTELNFGEARFTGTTTATLWFGSWGGGAIVHSPSTGAHEIHGRIWEYYRDHPQFGLPTTDETTTKDGTGKFNNFLGNSSIFWSNNTGAHGVYGDIWVVWKNSNQERGYGFPIDDEHDAGTGADDWCRSGEREQTFQRAGQTPTSACWRPGGGVYWQLHFIFS
jgi:hypothetical protein